VGAAVGDVPVAADSARVRRLKDLVLVRELRQALTSGEFALRINGAEQRPGLVDFEGLCRRLSRFQERLQKQPPDAGVLSSDGREKALDELRLTRDRLEERLVAMTRVERQPPLPVAAAWAAGASGASGDGGAADSGGGSGSGSSAGMNPGGGVEAGEDDGGATGDAAASSSVVAVPAPASTADALQEQLVNARAELDKAFGDAGTIPVKAQEDGRPSSAGAALGAVAAAKAQAAAAAAAAAPRFLLYLREDQTCDVDSALKESRAMAPFSRDLFARIRGASSHKCKEDEDWSSDPEASLPSLPSAVAERRSMLTRERHELDKAEAVRADVLRRMKQSSPSASGGTGAAAEAERDNMSKLAAELFQSDGAIEGHHLLALLAEADLLFERVAGALESQLENCDPAEWDHVGRQLKDVVFEFSLLDKQVWPYQRFMQDSAEALRARGLDSDELQMLRSHVKRIADRLGLPPEEADASRASPRRLLQKWARQAQGASQKARRGLLFYANGCRLLSQDLQHATKLVLKVACLSYTLSPRELQVCYRAVKDLVVLIPFLIILVLPLSPPGHVLVFSLIMKTYPDFFPTPFTERRQSVMRIFEEIKPVSDRRGKKSSWNAT